MLRFLLISLVIIFTLLLIKRDTQQIAPPESLTQPDEQAVELEPGIYYLQIEAPESITYITEKRIRYKATAWSSDGVTQFSSVQDGAYIYEFEKLRKMVPGFAKALANTSIGEKKYWWIEEKHMKPGFPNNQKGLQIFEIEVVGDE